MKKDNLSEKRKEFEKDDEIRNSRFIGRLDEDGKEKEIIFVYPEEDVKEKIQNVQRRLKEEIPEWLTNKQKLGGTLFNIHEIINKIFKEKFGGELI